LRRIGDRSAAPALLKLVESGSIVRGPAIVALGDLGDAGAIPTIQDSLSDYMPSVRAAARDALAKLAHTGR
jgi:HEAT repeat protein